MINYAVKLELSSRFLPKLSHFQKTPSVELIRTGGWFDGSKPFISVPRYNSFKNTS